MTDLTTTIAPKSDQLNADDLIGRTMTITVSGVRLLGEADQPVAIHFEGDNGKPYKPCKSMRRVMVHVWGGDGRRYAGRKMTLFRDEKVVFGGAPVGGIRISHMSDIDRPITMALTATRASRKPYTVQPLREAAQEPRHVPKGGPDTSLDEEAPEGQGPATPDTWDAAAWAQGQRDNADQITDPATFETWWSEVASSDDAKRLWQTDEPAWKSLRSHCAARLKTLKAGV